MAAPHFKSIASSSIGYVTRRGFIRAIGWLLAAVVLPSLRADAIKRSRRGVRHGQEGTDRPFHRSQHDRDKTAQNKRRRDVSNRNEFEPSGVTVGATTRSGGAGALRIEAAVRDVTVSIHNGSILPFNPRNPTVLATVELIDTVGSVKQSIAMSVTYDRSKGAYIGTANLPTNVIPGPYSVSVKFRDRVRTLRRIAPGVVQIGASSTTMVPRVTLIPGDVNNDNRLDIADYDRIINCMTHFGEPQPCSGEELKATDLDDSGVVDLGDENLFRRALQNQPGA